MAVLTEKIFDTPSSSGRSLSLSLNRVEYLYVCANEDEFKAEVNDIVRRTYYSGVYKVAEYLKKKGFKVFERTASYRVGVCQLYPEDEQAVQERESKKWWEADAEEEKYRKALLEKLPENIRKKFEEFDLFDLERDKEVLEYFKTFRP